MHYEISFNRPTYWRESIPVDDVSEIRLVADMNVSN